MDFNPAFKPGLIPAPPLQQYSNSPGGSIGALQPLLPFLQNESKSESTRTLSYPDRQPNDQFAGQFLQNFIKEKDQQNQQQKRDEMMDLYPMLQGGMKSESVPARPFPSPYTNWN